MPALHPGHVVGCKAGMATPSPFTRFVKEQLLPIVAPLGFDRTAETWTLSRIRDEVLQTLSVSVRGDEPQFTVWFSANALFSGHDFLPRNSGGTVSPDASWRAGRWAPRAVVIETTYGRAGSITGAIQGLELPWPWRERLQPRKDLPKSFAEICSKVEQVVVPWFRSGETVAGYLRHVEAEGWPTADHQAFERAVCLAKLERPEEARAAVAEALPGYEKRAAEYPQSGWSECLAKARRLEAALSRGEHPAVLAEWTENPVQKLKRYLPKARQAA